MIIGLPPNSTADKIYAIKKSTLYKSLLHVLIRVGGLTWEGTNYSCVLRMIAKWNAIIGTVQESGFAAYTPDIIQQYFAFSHTKMGSPHSNGI